jgi:hypothetical protein
LPGDRGPIPHSVRLVFSTTQCRLQIVLRRFARPYRIFARLALGRQIRPLATFLMISSVCNATE